MSIPYRTALARTYLMIQCLTLVISTTATPVTNVTSPIILTLPGNNGISDQCTKAKTWVANGFTQLDCNSVISYIYESEALRRDSQEYEFTSPGATPKTGLPKIVTPRRYTCGTCVLTIAMMDRFRPRELPGWDFRERYEETDVATFDSVWYAASNVQFWCVEKEKAGWVALGKHKSIGVLIMTTGSAEDRTIPEGPPFVAGANSTSSALITLPHMTDSNVCKSGRSS